MPLPVNASTHSRVCRQTTGDYSKHRMISTVDHMWSLKHRRRYIPASIYRFALTTHLNQHLADPKVLPKLKIRDDKQVIMLQN